MKRQKQNLFEMIQVKVTGRNGFDMSHEHKLSCNMGDIIPVMNMRVMPGDTVITQSEALLRMQALLAPLMHRVDLKFMTFYVPDRILWRDQKHYEAWLSRTPIGSPTPAIPAHPYLNMNADVYTPLADHLGIPIPPGGPIPFTEPINAIQFAAYQCIYNQRFRAQELIEEVDYLLDDGDNSGRGELLQLRKVTWTHDYFTSALTQPQAAAPVEIPLGEVELKQDWLDSDPSDPRTPNLVQVGGPGDVVGDHKSILGGDIVVNSGGPDSEKTAYDPDGTLQVGSTTINNLRTAIKVQEWKERLARAGRRLKEVIYAFFAVNTGDARVQDPEFITGSSTVVSISEVLNTTGTEEAPQGSMAGHGVSSANPRPGRYEVKEFGTVMTLMYIVPKTAYQDGIDRHFLEYDDSTNLPWPQFAHLGEQGIFNKEIYAFVAGGDETFGYVPRFAHWKYMNNKVSGEMRTSLSFWHLGRQFGSAPGLNQAFIECNPRTNIFAVDDPGVDHLVCHVFNNVYVKRKLPFFGTPSM